ncbi:MAG: NADPH-dependent F420 reductase [Steroidobacteraceae bacterium]
MKVAILGSGDVAKALAGGFMKHGHSVMLGTRDLGKLADWRRTHGGAGVGSFSDAAAFGDIAVLAVKGGAAIEALRAARIHNLDGKIVIDATNPIADAPPTSGVLAYFTSLEESLMERLQAEFPGIRFVKAFNSVGSAHMVDPKFAGGRPTMFICGNDAAAKSTVVEIVDRFGWDCEDMGGVQAARAIEPLCMLWCIRGFLRGQWAHAFKLLK